MLFKFPLSIYFSLTESMSTAPQPTPTVTTSAHVVSFQEGSPGLKQTNTVSFSNFYSYNSFSKLRKTIFVRPVIFLFSFSIFHNWEILVKKIGQKLVKTCGEPITLYYSTFYVPNLNYARSANVRRNWKQYLRVIGAMRNFFYMDNQKIVANTYHKVAGSRSVYYSILTSFSQRPQYVSIKFPLHK